MNSRESKNFEAFARISIELVNKFHNNEFMMKRVTQLISESIYRCPHLTSGYISIDAYLGKGQKVKEHFFSRTQSAKKIIEQILKNKSLRRITCIYKSRARCHITTQEENKNLIPYQKSPDYDYKHAYKEVVSKLIINEKFIYEIEGKEYLNSSDAAHKYSLTTDQINSRCLAKVKWSDWIRKLRHEELNES